MEKNSNGLEHPSDPRDSALRGRFWEESWTYVKTVVDIVREPVLILDSALCVITANEAFYHMFQVEPQDTEHKLVYKLGNGQWDIPALRKLLEDILPQNTFFKGFEVKHEFPFIGRKIMLLNARQIHFKEDIASPLQPPIILLAMEDVTEIMRVAEMISGHENQIETKLRERTTTLEVQMKTLYREMEQLKKRSTSL